MTLKQPVGETTLVEKQIDLFLQTVPLKDMLQSPKDIYLVTEASSSEFKVTVKNIEENPIVKSETDICRG